MTGAAGDDAREVDAYLARRLEEIVTLVAETARVEALPLDERRRARRALRRRADDGLSHARRRSVVSQWGFAGRRVPVRHASFDALFDEATALALRERAARPPSAGRRL